jgi:hypothetical protein
VLELPSGAEDAAAGLAGHDRARPANYDINHQSQGAEPTIFDSAKSSGPRSLFLLRNFLETGEPAGAAVFIPMSVAVVEKIIERWKQLPVIFVVRRRTDRARIVSIYTYIRTLD